MKPKKKRTCSLKFWNFFLFFVFIFCLYSVHVDTFRPGTCFATKKTANIIIELISKIQALHQTHFLVNKPWWTSTEFAIYKLRFTSCDPLQKVHNPCSPSAFNIHNFMDFVLFSIYPHLVTGRSFNPLAGGNDFHIFIPNWYSYSVGYSNGYSNVTYLNRPI